MPGLTGTLVDETYELDIFGGTAFEFSLPYVAPFDLAILLLITTQPQIIFSAPSRPASLISTLDLLTWIAPSRPTTLNSPIRSLTYPAPLRPAALVSTMDVLTWVAPSRPSALTSLARGGG